MNSFEDIRAHCSLRWTLRDNEPYLLSFDVPVQSGTRRQSLFLAELVDENDNRFLRVSTPVAPVGENAASRALRALRFNWEQRLGYLAISDLEGMAYLHLCENRPYELLDAGELDRVIAEIGPLADRLEQAIGARETDLH
jgi:hypothetical protein